MGIIISKPESSSIKRKNRDDEIDFKCEASKKPKIEQDALQLAEINDDCLQLIFEHLSVEDLVNVAETHQRFIASALAVFSRRYRKKKVFLNVGILHFFEEKNTEIRADFAVPFFRHFGAKVSSLFVNFIGRREMEIEQAILDHCAATLVSLELILCNVNNFESIKTPFENVQELTITKGSLGQNLLLLDIWFPNLIKLKLINVKPFNPVSIGVKCPRLEHLAIFNEKISIPLSNIVEMLRLNPQIKSFNLHCDYDAKFLRSMAKHSQQLEELILYSPDDRFLSFGDETMHFESVQKFTMIAPSYRRNEFVVNMPFTFQRLEQLSLHGFNEFRGQLINFILQNNRIRCLNLLPTVDDWDDLTYTDLTTIIEALPNLVSLQFCADMFATDDLIKILTKYKKLKQVQLLLIELPICIKTFAQTQKEWNLQVHYDDSEEFGRMDFSRKE